MLIASLALLAMWAAVASAIYGDARLSALGALACVGAGLGALALERARGHSSLPRARALRLSAALGLIVVGLLLAGSPDPLTARIAELRWGAAGLVGSCVLSALLNAYYLAGRPVRQSATATTGDEHGSNRRIRRGEAVAAMDAGALVVYLMTLVLYQVRSPLAFFLSTLMIFASVCIGLAALISHFVHFGWGVSSMPLPTSMAWVWLGVMFLAQVMVENGHRFVDTYALCCGWLLTGASGGRIAWLALVSRRWTPYELL